MPLKFIVEGKTEIKFFSDLLRNRFDIVLNADNFINLGGYNENVISKNLAQIQSAIAEGYTPVLIIDADANFNDRNLEINEQLINSNIPGIATFILPNNTDEGNIETLLLSLIRPSQENIRRIECFDALLHCLNGVQKLPGNKEKIYVLIDTYGLEASFDKRDYSNNVIWDLNSNSLNSLIDFIEPLRN